MRDPSADLHPLAAASLADQGLDPASAADAVVTVQAVMRSDIWEQQNSTRRLVEVPFQTLMPPDPNTADAVPVILRGVIDLVFREAAGWVVVDYKTDGVRKASCHNSSHTIAGKSPPMPTSGRPP